MPFSYLKSDVFTSPLARCWRGYFHCKHVSRRGSGKYCSAFSASSDFFEFLLRFSVGNLFLNVAVPGFCTTSSQHMPLRMYQTKSVAFLYTHDHHIISFSIGSGTDLTTEALVEWFVLRCSAQYRSFPLYLSVVAYYDAQILDPCGTGVSSIQSHLFLVCSRRSRFRLILLLLFIDDCFFREIIISHSLSSVIRWRIPPSILRGSTSLTLSWNTSIWVYS